MPEALGLGGPGAGRVGYPRGAFLPVAVDPIAYQRLWDFVCLHRFNGNYLGFCRLECLDSSRIGCSEQVN